MNIPLNQRGAEASVPFLNLPEYLTLSSILSARVLSFLEILKVVDGLCRRLVAVLIKLRKLEHRTPLDAPFCKCYNLVTEIL